MTKQVSSNWTPAGGTGSAVTQQPNSTSDADVLDLHMITVEANAPTDVQTLTTNWSGLMTPCISERATDETRTAFLRRHEIAIKSKATEEPIRPT
jgi:hypothetical protein